MTITHNNNIDFIGDIHGYAEPLRQLLTKLGYELQDDVWSHPTRKVCFLGDYIDRGNEQQATVSIVKNMVEAEQAYAIMGNHELNAIGWVTRNIQDNDFLRPHSDKNSKQHSAFLTQLTENSDYHLSIVEWFKTLPLFIDFGGMRVAHACWDGDSITRLQPHLTDINGVTVDALKTIFADNDLLQALEVITKGKEIALPEGYSFHDKDGHKRTDIRLKWWSSAEMTYREGAVIPEKDRHKIPDIPLTANLGYNDDVPVLFGHYWMSGTPHILTNKTACLDWSIAAKGAKSRKLCAYRWHGETDLSDDKLVWVDL